MRGVFEAIIRRRSIGKMNSDRPTHAQVEHIIETAVASRPYDHNEQFWRFLVLAGEARAELGVVMATSLQARLADTDDEKAKALLEKERNKPLRAPVVIVAMAEHPPQDTVREIENIAAVAAIVQNMLLVAEEQGLAAMWHTGDAAYDPLIKQWLGLTPEDHIVAFVYLGYPAITRPERKPISFQEKTVWLNWED